MYFPPRCLQFFTVQSFSTFLLRTYYVPSAELRPRGRAGGKIIPALLELVVSWGRKMSQTNNYAATCKISGMKMFEGEEHRAAKA